MLATYQNGFRPGRRQTTAHHAASWYQIFSQRGDFETVRAFSPLHNLREGECYPPTLITTADRDDRVVPAHSFKFAAELQRVQSCDNPVLIRIETRAGHGAGKPTTKRIEEAADIWAFCAETLQMEFDLN